MPDALTVLAFLTKALMYLTIFRAAGHAFCAVAPGIPAQDRIWIWAVLGAVFAGLGVALTAAVLGGRLQDALDPSLLMLLWDTSVGTSVALQVAGCLVLAGVLLMRGPRWAAAIAGLVALSGLVVTGHVSDRGGLLMHGVLLGHLAVGAWWMGILMPLWRGVQGPDRFGTAAHLADRFGQIARIAVPVLLLAGAVMGRVIVGSWSALWGTGYGWALCLKIATVAVLLLIATENRMRHVPGLLGQDPGAANALMRAVEVEAAAFVLILTLTAILTTTVHPPF